MKFNKNIPYEDCPCPAFLLDKDRLEENLKLIASVRDQAGIHIIMALKAFANWRVFPLIGEYLNGATASSLNEARLIYEEMGSKVHSYFVAYKEGEFDEVMKYSSHITFNSLNQYNRFRDRIASSGYEISIGIRVNPEFSTVETDLYNPASPGSRLGEAPNVFDLGWPEGAEGLHFHTLCESDSADLVATLGAIEEKFGAHLPQLKWVNMGGGHLMTRKDYDVQLLIDTLVSFKEKWGVDIILEPGSAISWQTGELVSEILDIHEARGIKTLILDVSFTAHMPDTLEMPYRPDILGQVEKSEQTHQYRVGGLSCLSGDYLMDYSFDKELSVGDKIVFLDMIHYTTVKTNMFNGISHPAIVHWDNNAFDVKREFGYEDYKHRMA